MMYNRNIDEIKIVNKMLIKKLKILLIKLLIKITKYDVKYES